METIAQAGAGDVLPSWFSGIVAGGACAILLAFIIWRLFGHLIPEFLKTLKEERDAFRSSLEKERSDYRQALVEERESNRQSLQLERDLHHGDMDKIAKAMGEHSVLLREQNVLLLRILDHQRINAVSDATKKED